MISMKLCEEKVFDLHSHSLPNLYIGTDFAGVALTRPPWQDVSKELQEIVEGLATPRHSEHSSVFPAFSLTIGGGPWPAVSEPAVFKLWKVWTVYQAVAAENGGQGREGDRIA